MPQHPWDEWEKPWTREQCRRRYVEGGDNIGLKKLVTESGRSLASLERWSSGDKWVQQRGEFEGSLRVKTTKKVIEKVSEYHADAIVNHWQPIFIEDLNRFRHISSVFANATAGMIADAAKSGAGHEGIINAIKAKELAMMGRVLEGAIKGLREVTGYDIANNVNVAIQIVEQHGLEIIDPTLNDEAD